MTAACKPPGKLAEQEGMVHVLRHREGRLCAVEWFPFRSPPEWAGPYGGASASVVSNGGWEWAGVLTPPDVVAGLVEALERCVGWLEDADEATQLEEDARAALARAKGVGV